jgi:RNA polymerase sigma-54 factor
MSNTSQRLDLRQSQNLVMTPQLQQAIKLLQLNNIELSEFIEEELAQNPLLEKKDENEDAAEGETNIDEDKDSIESGFDEAWTGNETNNEDFDPGSNMATVGGGGNMSFEDNDFSIENKLADKKSLREHLSEQLQIASKDENELRVGLLLIDQLDESGYLRSAASELSEKFGCPEALVCTLLKEMKQFDPTGVFACDLSECLSLQLEEQGKLDKPMKTLLENLPLLAAHDLGQLAKICEVNDTYLADMIEEIRELNPKPASSFEHIVVQTVIPDVLMKKLPKNIGGGWRVELNNDTLPKVLVNQSYYTEVAGKATDKKDKTYLDQQLQSANWLVRAMDQRAKTILKVAGEIIEEQEAFFLYGIEYLRPLTLKDIAERVDMHESTVSRVTNNKFIGTPRGIFELKFFFSTALGGQDGGDTHSSESVKARIKSMINDETAENILSDDAIVKALTDDGIDIARRTVAKYREALNIPSSIQRRRIKKSTQNQGDK